MDTAGAGTTEATEAIHQDPSDREPGRWPAVAGLLVGWLLPATVARRTHAVGLVRAYGHHLLGLLLILLSAIYAEAASLNGMKPNWRQLQSAAASLLPAPQLDPAWFFIALGFVGIELGTIILALLLTPWGAKNEPARDSLKHALRWCWLITSHVAISVVVVTALITWMQQAYNSWQDDLHRQAAHLVGLDPDLWTPYSQTSESDYWETRRTLYFQQEKDQPFYLREPYLLEPVIVAVGILWVLFAVLRGVGTRRVSHHMERPPLCRRCGYNLTGIDDTGRCPECGREIAASIGSQASPGSAWDRQGLRGWWRTTVDGLLHSTRLAQDLRLEPDRPTYRWYALTNLLGVVLVVTLGALAAALAQRHNYWWSTLRTWDAVFFCVLGVYAALAALALMLLAAGIAGLWHRRSAQASVLAGTMQMAAYGSSFLVIWWTFAMTAVVVYSVFEPVVQALPQPTRQQVEMALATVWIVLHAVFVMRYVGRVVSASAGVRDARE